jgi:NADPH:quinone reductase-like Zn-dependent oxidoreductase
MVHCNDMHCILNYTAKIPDNISDDEAATLVVGLIVGLVVLFDKDGFGLLFAWDQQAGKGKAILVVGGSSIPGLASTLLVNSTSCSNPTFKPFQFL